MSFQFLQDLGSAHRFNSFCFPKREFSFLDKGLYLPKFDVVLSCEVQSTPLPQKQDTIAVDAGLENFATFSNGEVVKSPQVFKLGKKKLARAKKIK